MSENSESHDSLEAFAETERTLRLARTRLGLGLGALMMPGGALLDLVLYPSYLSILLAIRFGTTAFLGVSWALLSQWNPGRSIRAISIVVLAIPALAICLMIGITDGVASNYFLGLILLLAVAQLMGYDGRDAAIFATVAILGYIAAVLFRGVSTRLEIERLVLAGFFLVTTAVVSVVLCHANHRGRWRDFIAQRTLDEKNRQLAEVDRLRAAFLAGVSHELKTPLTLILAPLDQLLSQRNAVSEKVGQDLAVVRRNGERLRGLVDDLLDVVRLDNAVLKLDLEPVDARELAVNVATAIRPLAEDRHLRLKIQFSPTPMILNIDAPRLERVLFNLLTNAIKFSQPDHEIGFEMMAGERIVRFAVSDHGPGVPVEEQDRIFDRFYQASNNRLRSSQGLGLGLALSRDIVRQLGGEISLTSDVGKGATFTVSLPGSPGVVGRQQRMTDENGAASGRPITTSVEGGQPIAAVESPEILVVDDEPELRNFIVDAMNQIAPTIGVATGSAGIEIALAQSPRVVVLDFMLPDLDGLHVLRTLRADERMRDTRIVMVTAQNDESLKVKALEWGADDFLPKPFGISELRARIQGLLRSSRLQHELREQHSSLARALEQLKATEAKLFQSEKMRAVGSMAAGLIHEINNPVNYTLMALDLMKRELEKGKDVSDLVVDAREGVARIGAIVSDLRGFAHPETHHVREDFHLGEAVEQAIRFCAQELTGIVVEHRDVGDSVIVHAGRSLVVQVLVNVLTNAAKATHKANRPGPIEIRATRSAERVFVAISDHGVGVSADDLPRLAEPFFSTAEPGEGLGLGLSICDTIIRNHGGSIRFESEPNVGTTVTFDLPATLEPGTTHANRGEEANPVCR